MKLAILSVTYKGSVLADNLSQSLGCQVDIYAKAGRNSVGTEHIFDSLSETVEKLFHEYDGLIFIMAAGIVVRVIAPLIRDKRFDPAVVIMDDGGQHVISLLSGHIGGANELAHRVAQSVGARPVITTATDVSNLPAADVLAVKLDLCIDPFENMKCINAAIVNGDRVAFFVDTALVNYQHYYKRAAEMGVGLTDINEIALTDKYDCAVAITDKELYMVKPHVYLRPSTLAIGIGCRRGTSSTEILAAIDNACRKIGRSRKSIAVIGTTLVKQDEVGLLATAQQLEVPVEFFTNEQLQESINQHQFETSTFVEKQIGVGNVCEPAALLGGQAENLLLTRTIYAKITIAIAEVKYQLWE